MVPENYSFLTKYLLWQNIYTVSLGFQIPLITWRFSSQTDIYSLLAQRLQQIRFWQCKGKTGLLCFTIREPELSLYPNSPGLCRVRVWTKRWKSCTVHDSLCVAAAALLLSGLMLCGSLKVIRTSVENWGRRSRPRWRVTVFLASSLNLDIHCVPVSIQQEQHSDSDSSALGTATTLVTSKAPGSKALLLPAISSKWYLTASCSATWPWYSTSSTMRLWSVCAWANTSWLSGISLRSLTSVALWGMTADSAPPKRGRGWWALLPAPCMSLWAAGEKQEVAVWSYKYLVWLR